jgi:hypothetical protein
VNDETPDDGTINTATQKQLEAILPLIPRMPYLQLDAWLRWADRKLTFSKGNQYALRALINTMKEG